jgi:cytochrome o ubiquinol oxidase operon protein cyoD
LTRIGIAVWTIPCVIAVIQAELGYFLHLGTRREQRKNSVAFVQTGLLIAIGVDGSLWGMYNADENLMRTSTTSEAAQLRQ